MGDGRSDIPNAAPDLRGHIPGPWTVDERQTNCGGPRIMANRVAVADCYMVGDGGEAGSWTANAQLIAAAPDMLKALQAMTDATEMFGPPSLRAARDLAFRAISKASGREGPRETPPQQERSQP